MTQSTPGEHQNPYPPNPYAQSPYPAPPGFGMPQDNDRTNGFAIAALVLGILGITLLAIIFGCVAISQINRRGGRGKGMAVAGITCSIVWVLILVVTISASGA